MRVDILGGSNPRLGINDRKVNHVGFDPDPFPREASPGSELLLGNPRTVPDTDERIFTLGGSLTDVTTTLNTMSKNAQYTPRGEA